MNKRACSFITMLAISMAVCGCGKSVSVTEKTEPTQSDGAGAAQSDRAEAETSVTITDTETIITIDGETAGQSDISEITKSEMPIVTLPFEPSDFNLLGYDVFADHFDSICGTAECPPQEYDVTMNWLDTPYGKGMSFNNISDFHDKVVQFMPDEEFEYYLEWHAETGTRGNGYECSIKCWRNSLFTEAESTVQRSRYMDFSKMTDAPVSIGDSYEKWHEVIGFEEIKENGILVRENEWDDDKISMTTEYEFETQWGHAGYIERTERYPQGDDVLYCWIFVEPNQKDSENKLPENVNEFTLGAVFDSSHKLGKWSAAAGLKDKLK